MNLIKLLRKKFSPFFRIKNAESMLEKALDAPSIKKLENLISVELIKNQYLQKYNEKDLFYFLFENIFYDSEIIIKIQKNYIDFIPKDSENCFLDIGCGRGEFLSILETNNILSKGIEINLPEVDLLKKQGVNVEYSDAISYLRKSDEIFSGISAFQVAEHLKFDELFELVKLAYGKIEEGGVLILETLNPSNSMCAKMFYNDFTHVKPIPKNSLQFLCEFIGFKNIKLCESINNGYGYINYALVCEK